jgi:hypothetical protein
MCSSLNVGEQVNFDECTVENRGRPHYRKRSSWPSFEIEARWIGSRTSHYMTTVDVIASCILIFIYWTKGQCRATVHRRVCEYSVTGGRGTVCEKTRDSCGGVRMEGDAS